MHNHAEFTPRIIADAFYNGEVEAELRCLDRIDYLFKKDSDREDCMEMIESMRRMSTYPHPAVECAPDCKDRGIYNSELFINQLHVCRSIYLMMITLCITMNSMLQVVEVYGLPTAFGRLSSLIACFV